MPKGPLAKRAGPSGEGTLGANARSLYNPRMGTRPGQPELPTIDVREHGASRGEREQTMDRRLFMQLLVGRAPAGVDPQRFHDAFESALEDEKRLSAVVYADVSDPRGFGLLTWSEDPTYFVEHVRPIFRRQHLQELEMRPDMTMFGRTYSVGYEQNLPFWLLQKPVDTVTNAEWPWAVWYPLRRLGAFNQLDAKETRGIMGEHATIGRAYGAQDLAHDVRLACHGIDQNDNEFVIGLVGKELHPLSHLVQAMRKTVQTSTYMEKMGPFFVGRVLMSRVGE